MVLWEITVATAYFLGLKRTYKLALRIQRRLISPKYPKIRQFAHRRTRMIFDVALKVHHKVQQRDIEVGRNLGNWILRRLDQIKPSAHIRAPPSADPTNSPVNMTKQLTKSAELKTPVSYKTPKDEDSGRHLFTTYKNVWSRPLASMSMIRVRKPLGSMTHYRYIGSLRPPNYAKSGSQGVFRKDVLDWMHRN